MSPRIVIAGTGSGVGKTSLALGLTRALVRRGLRVQPFKVGPDFLDPTYLALAAGRTCYNLDGWMTGLPYVQRLFARATADADLAVIEGVMGLYDGASATSLEGSTAEIALALDAPVLLVAGVHGVARSLAAVVKGFATLEPGVRLAGVIANQSGSEKHRALLAEALSAAGLPPLVGTVPRGALPALQSRHLGLVSADPHVLPPHTIEALADACEKHLDLNGILKLASEPEQGWHAQSLPARWRAAVCLGMESRATAPCSRNSGVSMPPVQPRVRLGLARDEAFHFYYPDNLEILRGCGADLIEFSPLHDTHLPAGLHGLYLGGGYPEAHAEALSANHTLLDDVRQFAAAGRCIYAECGGMMLLGRAISDLAGRRWPMAGVLPIETAMLDRLQSLGYVEASPAAGSLLSDGDAAASDAPPLRGHEFHYSRVAADDSAAEGWRPAYRTHARRGGAEADAGFFKGRIMASYIHVHLASCPRVAERLVARCGETQ